MIIFFYFICLGLILTHSFHALRDLNRHRWNFNRHGLLAIFALTFLAITNAFVSYGFNVPQSLEPFFRFCFGAGRYEGVTQLGLAGFYWAGIITISVLVMFISGSGPYSEHNTERPLGIVKIVFGLLVVFLALFILLWGIS
jgi:hypothetical protein